MRKLLSSLLLLGICLAMSAQGTTKINSIKRNPLYLYAEATMETSAEAYEVASELLYVQAKEYAAGKKAFANKDILLRNIKTQQDSVQMRRGEMYKVFLYIKKSDVMDVDNVTLVASGENSAAAAAANSAAPAREETPGGIPVVVLPEAKPAGTGSAKGDASLKLASAWQQALVDDLLAQPSLSAAKAKLGRYKAEYKVKNTGPLSTCRNLPAAFLLVGKNGQVLTVLGPGADERTDFKTLTRTKMDKYPDTDVIWFNLAK